jgi:peptidoglycan/xylan/chitin deacetylase (PgdA/CDA1 family)
VRFSEGVLGSARGLRVAVTFGDGYRSVLELAKPILGKLGWPATLYVPTDHVATGRPMSWPGIDNWVGGPFEDELLPLSWDELRELQAAGWEIGSHTCSHPHLTTLADGDLLYELVTARTVCEHELGEECLSIAYPYGDVAR